MRVGDLLGGVVRTSDDTVLGRVADVRLVGSLVDGKPDLHLDGLLLVPGRWTRLLGYDHDNLKGPWLLRVLARRSAAGKHFVPWQYVDSYDHHTIRLRPGPASLDDLEPAPGLDHSWPTAHHDS
ncbi:hypothetical protein [Tenggerimyces flavus]|uniref:PRC-barrel domain containing protein n=1 Tax=Tenggerimyces flavus TaxID=1708749 RepID=A0ABV7Y3A5_9ACTN|nr:hypothetical protein [Tenggerimyces flavus]MBM7790356.1 hypothetical protein [Tenggerimyces flavus]